MAETETGIDRFANATPRPWRVGEGAWWLYVVAANGTEPTVAHATGLTREEARANVELIVDAVNSYSPSDAEQLIELRKLLRSVREAACNHRSIEMIGNEVVQLIPQIDAVIGEK